MTDLADQKLNQSDLLNGSKSPAERKVSVNIGNFKPAEPHSQWDVCITLVHTYPSLLARTLNSPNRIISYCFQLTQSNSDVVHFTVDTAQKPPCTPSVSLQEAVTDIVV